MLALVAPPEPDTDSALSYSEFLTSDYTRDDSPEDLRDLLRYGLGLLQWLLEPRGLAPGPWALDEKVSVVLEKVSEVLSEVVSSVVGS